MKTLLWNVRHGTALCVAAAIVFCAAGFKAPDAAAAVPRVLFDVSGAVACQDVTSEEFAAAHAGEKLVEAAISVSVLVAEGAESDLDELLIVVRSPERRLRVVELSPDTELASEFSDSIKIVESNESTTTKNLGIGGTAGGDYGGAHLSISPTAGVGRNDSQGVRQTYHKLPPMQLVVASGTTSREHGAFFKLRPSNQYSLQGRREYVIRFAVPQAWRGDWIEVACRSQAIERSYLSTSVRDCGSRRAAVGLFLAGDEEAQQLALRVASPAGSEQTPESTSDRTTTSTTTSSTTRHTTLRPQWTDRPLLAHLSRLLPISTASSSVTQQTQAQSTEARQEVDPRLRALEELAGGK